MFAADVKVLGKAMRSENIIEYSIKNQVETNISQKYSSDYDAILFLMNNLFLIKTDIFRLLNDSFLI